MNDTASDEQIRQLREELERETDRADRAQIEAHIVWEALATMREMLVKHRLNVTMLRAYEPIKALEGAGLDREIERRLEAKRAREQALAPADPEQDDNVTEEDDS